MAAASVTRTRSRARLRSGASGMGPGTIAHLHRLESRGHDRSRWAARMLLRAVLGVAEAGARAYSMRGGPCSICAWACGASMTAGPRRSRSHPDSAVGPLYSRRSFPGPGLVRAPRPDPCVWACPFRAGCSRHPGWGRLLRGGTAVRGGAQMLTEVVVRVLKESNLVPRRVREVLEVTLDDEPGALGRYCRRLADASINLEAVYLSGEHDGSKELVFAVSDLDRARRL